MAGELRNIYGGDCSAWQLPPDGTGPREARDLTRKALEAIGLTGGFVDDAVTMASELATNAYLHGRSTDLAGVAPSAPELWLYLVRRPQMSVVCKVFDGNRRWVPPN